MSCVCEFINLFYIALCLFRAVYKFVCKTVIHGDQQKGGWNLWQWRKENSWYRYEPTSLSLVTDEDPLIGNVLRMTVTACRKLDFSKVGLDTIIELGMLSVEPTHTGRGMQTCLIAGYRWNYVLLLAIWYLVWKLHDTAWPFRCEPSSDHAVPTAAVYCVGSLDIHCICNVPRTVISNSSTLYSVSMPWKVISEWTFWKKKRYARTRKTY